MLRLFPFFSLALSLSFLLFLFSLTYVTRDYVVDEKCRDKSVDPELFSMPHAFVLFLRFVIVLAIDAYGNTRSRMRASPGETRLYDSDGSLRTYFSLRTFRDFDMP